MKTEILREIASFERIQARASGRIVHQQGLAIFCAAGLLPPINRVTRCFGAVVETLQAGSVLDLGCGTGILALIAARFAEVVLGVDIDPRAIACARYNAALNRLDNARFLPGDGYAPVSGMRFDLILSNPPFYPPAGLDHAPRSLCVDPGNCLLEALILGIPEHLEPGGQALFVTSSLSDNGDVESLLRRTQLDFSRRLLHRGEGQSQDIYLWKVVI